MRVVVTGSLAWTDGSEIERALAKLPRGSVVVQGGARGADRLAATIARRLGFEVEEYPANWTKYGKGAGAIRNKQMIDSKPDFVLAFQLDQSRGTQMTMNMAKRVGIEVRLVERFTLDER